MASVLKRESDSSLSERDGLCQATTRKGEPCRRKALDADGLCLVHNGSQDMRELGRLGGRAIPKAKRRTDAERESLREFLRREVDPADVWEAIRSSLASSNERDKLAGAKLLLAELYEPAADRERVQETEAAHARERFATMVDGRAARAVLRTLVEHGVIRPGPGRPFTGVVKFGLRELAEWATTWAPVPVTVEDVACPGCGVVGVRLFKEGEVVSNEPVYCAICRPDAGAETSVLAPANVRLKIEPSPDVPLRRRSLA